MSTEVQPKEKKRKPTIECADCHKFFSRIQGLRSHERTHRNLKMGFFKCDICDMFFKSRFGLFSHNRHRHEAAVRSRSSSSSSAHSAPPNDVSTSATSPQTSPSNTVLRRSARNVVQSNGPATNDPQSVDVPSISDRGRSQSLLGAVEDTVAETLDFTPPSRHGSVSPTTSTPPVAAPTTVVPPSSSNTPMADYFSYVIRQLLGEKEEHNQSSATNNQTPSNLGSTAQNVPVTISPVDTSTVDAETSAPTVVVTSTLNDVEMDDLYEPEVVPTKPDAQGSLASPDNDFSVSTSIAPAACKMMPTSSGTLSSLKSTSPDPTAAPAPQVYDPALEDASATQKGITLSSKNVLPILETSSLISNGATPSSPVKKTTPAALTSTSSMVDLASDGSTSAIENGPIAPNTTTQFWELLLSRPHNSDPVLGTASLASTEYNAAFENTPKTPKAMKPASDKVPPISKTSMLTANKELLSTTVNRSVQETVEEKTPSGMPLIPSEDHLASNGLSSTPKDIPRTPMTSNPTQKIVNPASNIFNSVFDGAPLTPKAGPLASKIVSPTESHILAQPASHMTEEKGATPKPRFTYIPESFEEAKNRIGAEMKKEGTSRNFHELGIEEIDRLLEKSPENSELLETKCSDLELKQQQLAREFEQLVEKWKKQNERASGEGTSSRSTSKKTVSKNISGSEPTNASKEPPQKKTRLMVPEETTN